jgi:hypothetical protein
VIKVATRLQIPKAVSRDRKNITEWLNLARTAVEAAEHIGDRRAFSLRAAITEGKSEKVLRQMGIICESDVEREFPKK